MREITTKTADQFLKILGVLEDKFSLNRIQAEDWLFVRNKLLYNEKPITFLLIDKAEVVFDLLDNESELPA